MKTHLPKAIEVYLRWKIPEVDFVHYVAYRLDRKKLIPPIQGDSGGELHHRTTKLLTYHLLPGYP